MSCLLLFLLCITSRAGADLSETIQHLDEIHTILNKNELAAQRERLEAHEGEIQESLKRNPQQEEILEDIVRRTPLIEESHYRPMGDTIEEINKHARIGDLLYQSDIVLSREQLNDVIESAENDVNGRKKRQAVNRKNLRGAVWPRGVVYYQFHRALNPNITRLVKKAMLQWQQETCLEFFEDNYARTRIEIISHDEGCWSNVGPVIGKAQQLSLGEGCDLIGSVLHELGHSLGFWHTHSRSDRNLYVFIAVENIEAGGNSEFIVSDPTKNENYGIPYDFGSIMHYGSKFFSINDNHTMFSVDVRYIDTMGSPFLSFYDKLMMNVLYNCLDRCKFDRNAAKCKMGGFPNPRDCSKCVCPGGYGGRLCDERPAGCGKVLEATTTYSTLNDTIGYDGVWLSNEVDDYKQCYYWIKAPPKRKVEVRITHFSPSNVANDGCFIAGFEIKAQRDQGMTGYRYCSPAYIGNYFVSYGNLLPIITYSKAWKVNLTLVYKYI